MYFRIIFHSNQKTHYMSATKLLLTTSLIIAATCSAFSQISADSIQSLKQQKLSLELSGKINDNKIKLAKMENEVDRKNSDVRNTAAEAKSAAADNQEAASNLTNNPQDKSLARKAEKSANLAQKNAKRARVAADDLSNLLKDIQSLKNKIADQQSKLAVNPLIPEVPASTIPAQQ